MFRFDQLVTALARRRLWLTDAYYAGVAAYVQALKAAARDGVDVRLLVPNGTDIPILRPLSRAGYRPLLEAGVRVFEWNGTMVHAKTAVADGQWGRVGSTNLNIASWLGNCELDAVIEEELFAWCGIHEPACTGTCRGAHRDHRRPDAAGIGDSLRLFSPRARIPAGSRLYLGRHGSPKAGLDAVFAEKTERPQRLGRWHFNGVKSRGGLCRATSPKGI